MVVFFFSASYAAIIFTGNRQNSEGNVNSYLFFVIYSRPNVQKCATSRVNSRRENIWVITFFGFFGGPVAFLIHWPPSGCHSPMSRPDSYG